MIGKRLLLLPVLSCLVAASAFAATVRVKADNTPLRTSPLTSAAVVEQLKAGTMLEVLGTIGDWYEVRNPLTKKSGYVPRGAVEAGTGPAPTGAGTQKPGTATAGAKPATRPALPPKKGDWLDRGYLSVGGIYQTTGSSFTQTQTGTYFAEAANATIEYPAITAPGFDIAGGYRIWRNLAVGAGLTYVSGSVTTVVGGTLPNPLYLNKPVALSGGFNANHSEAAVDVQVAWVMPLRPKMLLMLVGGPSFVHVTQALVTGDGLGSSLVYPYDSGTITSATTTDSSRTAIGFSAGADFTYLLSKTIGVGGVVRYARASASFPVTGQPSVPVVTGGLEVGGGLRILFPPPKPAKPSAPGKPPEKPKTPPKKK